MHTARQVTGSTCVLSILHINYSQFLAKSIAVKDLDIAVEFQLAAEELSEDTVVFR